MGTKRFLIDLIQSYIDNKIPKPLERYAVFDRTDDVIGIGIEDYYTAKASYEELNERCLTISFYNGYLASDKENYNVYMTKNDICIIDENDEDSFVVDNDVIFNISLRYNFTLTLEDLYEIHQTFIKLIGQREITKLEIFYTAGEEKTYGY